MEKSMNQWAVHCKKIHRPLVRLVEWPQPAVWCHIYLVPQICGATYIWCHRSVVPHIFGATDLWSPWWGRNEGKHSNDIRGLLLTCFTMVTAFRTAARWGEQSGSATWWQHEVSTTIRSHHGANKESLAASSEFPVGMRLLCIWFYPANGHS